MSDTNSGPADILGETTTDADVDLYAILNVDKHASFSDIRTQYKHLAKLLHPDKVLTRSNFNAGIHNNTNNTNVNSEIVEKLFLRVQFAHKVLSNEVLRQIYDDYGLNGVRAYIKEIETAQAAQNFNLNNSNNIKEYSDLDDEIDVKKSELAVGKYDKLGENIRDRVIGRMLVEREFQQQEKTSIHGIVNAKFDPDLSLREMQIQQSIGIPMGKNHVINVSASMFALTILKRQPKTSVSNPFSLGNLLAEVEGSPQPQQMSQNIGMGTLKIEHEYEINHLTNMATEFKIATNAVKALPMVDFKLHRVLSPILNASLSLATHLNPKPDASSAGMEITLERKIMTITDNGKSNEDEIGTAQSSYDFDYVLRSNNDVYFHLSFGQGKFDPISIGLSSRKTALAPSDSPLRRKTNARHELLRSMSSEDAEFNLLSKKIPILEHTARFTNGTLSLSNGLKLSYVKAFSSPTQTLPHSVKDMQHDYFNKYNTTLLHAASTVSTIIKQLNVYNIPNFFNIIDRFHGFYDDSDIDNKQSLEAQRKKNTVYIANLSFDNTGIDLEAGVESRTHVQDHGISLVFSFIQGLFLNLKFRRKQLNFIFPFKLVTTQTLLQLWSNFEIASLSTSSIFSGFTIFGMMRILIFGKVVDLALIPVVKYLDLEEQNYWIRKETDLRNRRVLAKSHRDVMISSLRSSSKPTALNILKSKYGAKSGLHKEFFWEDEEFLRKPLSFAKPQMSRPRSVSDEISAKHYGFNKILAFTDQILTFGLDIIKRAISSALKAFDDPDLTIAERANEINLNHDQTIGFHFEDARDLIESHPENIDVSAQLQFFIKENKIVLPQKSKASILGFYNPLEHRPELGTPELYVRYEVANFIFEITFQDFEPIEVPSSRAILIGNTQTEGRVNWSK